MEREAHIGSLVRTRAEANPTLISTVPPLAQDLLLRHQLIDRLRRISDAVCRTRQHHSQHRRARLVWLFRRPRHRKGKDVTTQCLNSLGGGKCGASRLTMT
jgi:hypothetical protein